VNFHYFDHVFSSSFLQDCPSVPVGRGPRTDVLLRAENVVLEAGGCVLRLAGLYISSTYKYYFFKNASMNTELLCNIR
jgi:hypothetical protein